MPAHSKSLLHSRALLILAFLSLFACQESNGKKEKGTSVVTVADTTNDLPDTLKSAGSQRDPVLDTVLFDRLLQHMVHDSPNKKWPVAAAYPLPGAILPFKRVVAFYGNFYSRGMGILGEISPGEMLRKLQGEVKEWEAADPLTPVKPALHYIAVTAQKNPGKRGKYCARMPGDQVEKTLTLARKIDAIVFLDIQVGHCSLEEELMQLEPYLKLPDVHLGIDPEYSMKGGEVPCTVLGTYDAEDVNLASAFLARVVRKYKLPPKMLIVHRFTKGMLTNYRSIVTRPEVQIVISMDGFGFPAKKKDSYKTAVSTEPVQFAGFKLFYRNDKLGKPFRLMSKEEVLRLYPSPLYIQYQ